MEQLQPEDDLRFPAQTYMALCGKKRFEYPASALLKKQNNKHNKYQNNAE